MLPKSIKNLSFGVRGSDFCDFGKVLGGFEKANFLLSKKIGFLPPKGVQGGRGADAPGLTAAKLGGSLLVRLVPRHNGQSPF